MSEDELDLTELRSAEHALRESEERFRLAAQAGRMFAYSWDAATDLIERSGESATILGIDEAAPLTGHQAIGRVHPDDREGVLAAIAGLSPEKPLLQVTYRIVRPNTSVIWVERHSQAYFDEHGKIKRIVGMIVDITERKRAQRELSEANERLNLTMEAARIGCWEANIKDGRSFWFGQTHALLGLSREVHSASTETFWDRVHQGDRGWLQDALRESMRSHNELTAEFRVVWPDRSVHWLRSQARFFYGIDGQAERMLGISMDITGRKRAEEALLEMNRTLEAQGSLLRSREELLKVFVKNVPAAVAMLDRDLRYLQVSDRWCSDYLPGRAEILGRFHYEIFPDMPERWKEVHRRALQGETLRADEDRWDGQDGTHWARWEVRPWKSAEGAVGGILILAEDITRRKQMEQTLAETSRKLIESQEQERVRIARELHDDINQRLAVVAIGLDQLREKRKDLPSEVRDQVKELHQMTSDISSNVYALSHELYSLIPDSLGLARGMESWCREFGGRRKMKIDFKSHDLPRLPQEISLCLFRVLQEALHNAAKHSGAKRVDVQLAQNSGDIHLIVSDSGKGFDIDAAKKKGGLGLTSMQERVRLVGGTMVIDSKPLAGTTIHARVPFGAERILQTAAG